MLLDLDNMKTNMTTASKALQVRADGLTTSTLVSYRFPPLKEADNWSTLTADLDAILDSKDVDKISGRILGMQQCLVSQPCLLV